jgi:hypothetical protein
MSFAASNIDFQDRYKLTNLVNGVDGGDSVAMRQLVPVLADIQAMTANMSNYVQSAQFGDLFNSARNNADLLSGSQVNAAIAAAIAGIPPAESRLASLAVKTVFEGSLADAQVAAPTMGLIASDSGDFEDASSSCVLVNSPNPAETGVYQWRTNNTLQSLNATLIAAQLGYYTRFYVITSGNRPGREYAIISLDAANNGFEVEEIPYTDEYTGLGPIVVNNQNKTINLSFSAADFVVTGGGEFQLHQAVKAALAQMPVLVQDLDALETIVNDLNANLSNQIQTLTGQVNALSQTVSGHTQNISTLQTSLGDALARIAQLEVSAMRLGDLQDTIAIWFQAGIPSIKNALGVWVPAPSNLVQEISGNADVGIYRIIHSRGVPILPIYAEANNQGQATRVGFIYRTIGLTPDWIELEVEKYKGVILTFPAGIKSTAFITPITSF